MDSSAGRPSRSKSRAKNALREVTNAAPAAHERCKSTMPVYEEGLISRRSEHMKIKIVAINKMWNGFVILNRGNFPSAKRRERACSRMLSSSCFASSSMDNVHK